METLDILKTAIESRKPISFKYNLEGRAIGLRFGDPHAVYLSSKDQVNIHIWKTGGVKTDLTQVLPTWRTYSIKYIEEITILKDQPNFSLAPDYKPNSPMYSRALAKV
jgi:hypothetical protein